MTISFSASIPEQGLIRFTRESLAAFKPLVATPVQIASLLFIFQGSIIQTSLSIPIARVTTLAKFTIPVASITVDCLAAILYFQSVMRSLQQLSRAQQFTPFVMAFIYGLEMLSIYFSSAIVITFCGCITAVFSSFIWWRYIGELYANKSHVLRTTWQVSWVLRFPDYIFGRINVIYSLSLVLLIFISSLISSIPHLSLAGGWLIPQLWWFCAWEISFFIPSSSGWEDLKRLW